MAKQRAQAIKFDTINKSQIKGRVGHSRTGACTARGKCNHGWIVRPKGSAGGRSGSKRKIGKF